MFQIDVSGIDNILKRLEKFEDIDTKLDEIARRLCEVGQQVVESGFGSHAVVYTTSGNGVYQINIEGNEVLFIEFGTGDAAGIHAAQYDAVPSVVRPGSWSEKHSKQYSTKGYWYWGRTRFTETPPHPYTYDAYRAMVDALPQIVNEVFRS